MGVDVGWSLKQRNHTAILCRRTLSAELTSAHRNFAICLGDMHKLIREYYGAICIGGYDQASRLIRKPHVDAFSEILGLYVDVTALPRQ